MNAYGSPPAVGQASLTRPRRSLFVKYFITLFVAVVGPLLMVAATEAWFGYRDQRVHLNDLLQAESRSAADRIQTFIEGIRNQLGWMVQLPWKDGEDERHKIDALRLLRQVPAITSVALLDETGTERVFVSRTGLNRTGRGANMSNDPGFLGVSAAKVWYGPVRYQRNSEPFMTIAVAGNRATAGVAIADINLKLIWDVISAIKIGDTGYALAIDDSGRLIAHPDISLVLRGDAAPASLERLKSAVAMPGRSAVVTSGADDTRVVAVAARTAGPGWFVIAQQPVAEAFNAIRVALWRSLAFVVIGALFAFALAYWLARRMSGPIQQLEHGTERIGAGQFDYRVTIKTGDELEQLADRFNAMAGELATSKEKSERITRLKQFLAPQVAELVEHSGDDRLLKGQRREVVAIFGDLRGFTAFSSHAEPDIIMGVLAEYYAALGKVITEHQGTLTGFAGDGLMVLVNAPVACADPALRGLRLAIDMQAAVQALITRWRASGHAIGFGVGIAMGQATVGTIGYEGRIDYTAIGSVINLASRLCGSALDSQILADPVIASAVGGTISLDALGSLPIKGYDKPLQVFSVARGN